jgi:phage-related minor tail protein
MRDKDLDEETREYINYLHQRIQFLEQELEDSEKTVLELKQEQSQAPELPSVDIEGILDKEPSREELEELSAEDFSQFEDRMLHDPEEILEDPEKALEELQHVTRQAQEHNEKVSKVNDKIRENNDDWFGKD